MDYASILTGIGAGVTYSLTSYAKKEGQKFDPVKFVTTIVIGGVTGAVMGAFNLEMEVVNTYAIQIGAVTIIENLVKTVWRKVFKKSV